MKRCEDHVTKLGYDVIYLHCGEKQVPALELYSKMGFRPRKRIYSEDQGRHMLLMKKTIKHTDVAASLDDFWAGDVLKCNLPDSRVAHVPDSREAHFPDSREAHFPDTAHLSS